jgi:hypothetical protein
MEKGIINKNKNYIEFMVIWRWDVIVINIIISFLQFNHRWLNRRIFIFKQINNKYQALTLTK